MNNCENCNSALNGKYCSNCGNPVELKRINGEYIIHAIGSILNFEKGFFYTIKELLLRPGATIKNFILKDRNRLVKPVIFLIITSLLYTLVDQIFKFEAGYINYRESKETSVLLYSIGFK